MPFSGEKSMLKSVLPALAASLVFTAAHAAGNMKPGLWEITTQSDAMQRMPKIPPEQIERMRKMGVEVPQMQNGGIVSKVCITPEMAQRDQWPQAAQNAHDCTTGAPQAQGNAYTADIVCKGPNIKGKGTLKASFADSTSFSSSSSFNGTAGGQPIKDHSTTSGKWLSADCGTVKPVAQKK
jgi:hypothetical protein